MTAEAEYAAVPITVTVNGVKHDAVVEPRTLLVYFLREHLGLTGTHVGCDTSQCGACTVHLDGRAVKSCTILAAQANGAEVKTIEGLADGDIFHPGAGRLPRKTWTAVRLLHAGHDHDGCAFVGNELEPNRRRDQARARRQYLPLHRLRQYRRIGQMGSSQNGRKKCFPLVSATSQRARSKKRWN